MKGRARKINFLSLLLLGGIGDVSMPSPESDDGEGFHSPEPEPEQEVIDLEEEEAAADGVAEAPQEKDDRPASGGNKLPRTPYFRTALRRGHPGSSG